MEMKQIDCKLASKSLKVGKVDEGKKASKPLFSTVKNTRNRRLLQIRIYTRRNSLKLKVSGRAKEFLFIRREV